MRVPLIAGNWKMHKTVEEAERLAGELVQLLAGFDEVEVAVAPPFTALHSVGAKLRASPIALAAQNMHWEAQGAYTGEISAAMFREAGCRYVILGHSERRQLFGETDEGVARKAKSALAAGLTPILCVGETLEERRQGEAFPVVERQVRGALAELEGEACRRVVFAYEPVWAIGTGQTATSGQAQEVHRHLRHVLGELDGAAGAAQVRILYGGSVKPTNAAELMAQEDVDGALVGGASLDAEGFASIARFRV
jgi:triosephosphate isomerase (TIM)